MGAVLVSILGYSTALIFYAGGFVLFGGAIGGKFNDGDNAGIAFWLSLAFLIFGFGVCAATAKLTGAI